MADRLDDEVCVERFFHQKFNTCSTLERTKRNRKKRKIFNEGRLTRVGRHIFRPMHGKTVNA
jgi:hypothetical protein